MYVLERRCSNATFDLQFDEEIMGRQEASAQLLQKEEKINELEAEVQAFRSQVLPFFIMVIFFSPIAVTCFTKSVQKAKNPTILTKVSSKSTK